MFEKPSDRSIRIDPAAIESTQTPDQDPEAQFAEQRAQLTQQQELFTQTAAFVERLKEQIQSLSGIERASAEAELAKWESKQRERLSTIADIETNIRMQQNISDDIEDAAAKSLKKRLN